MWLFLVALTLLALSSAAAAEEVDCSKMKTKELKQFLARKGKKCEGCMEKADFVSLCAASTDLPDVPEEEQPQQKAKKKANDAGDDKAKSIDELLASMKGMPGMENIKVSEGHAESIRPSQPSYKPACICHNFDLPLHVLPRSVGLPSG